MQQLHVIGPLRAPDEIDAAIKAIDPKAELIHLEGPKWWLGVRAPNPAAEEQLADAHHHASRRPTIEDPAERAFMEVELAREFAMYQVMASGFRPIALYTIDGGVREDGWTWGEVVDDFRQRDYNWRNTPELHGKRALKRSVSMDRLNAERIVEFGKKAADAAREAYRFVFRRSVSSTRRVGDRRVRNG